MIEIQDEEDKTVSIDLCAGEGKMLAVSIEPSGKITWAIHWDGHREHGKHQMPKREWVGLTEEEKESIVNKKIDGAYLSVMQIIELTEAKLKEKNT